MLTVSARQLRLTVQHGVETRETKISERRAEANEDTLIGGVTKLKRAA
jgi:hypothetical protein